MSGKTGGRGLFASHRSYVLCFVMGALVCVFINGAFRTYGKPERYRLFLTGGIVPKPNWRTYGVSAYSSLHYWRSIDWGDFRPIHDASAGRRMNRGHPLYTPEELSRHSASFVYTPVVAMLMTPLTYFDVRTAADWVSFINHLLWAGGLVVILKIAAYGRRLAPIEVLLLVGHYLIFYPMAKALELTQASVWVFFLLAVSALLFQRKRFAPAGAVLAGAVSIKPHLVLLLILLGAARRLTWRFVISAAVTLAVLGALCLLYAGWANIHDYLFELLPVLSNGLAYYPNQSLNGLLLRLYTDLDPAEFNLAPAVGWIKNVCSVWGLALLAAAWIPCRAPRGPRDHDGDVLCYVLATVAVTIASPIVWIHHFTAFFVPMAVACNYLARFPQARRLWFELLMLVGWWLVTFFFDSQYLKSGWLVLLGSLGFYGSLLLVIALAGVVVAANRQARRAPCGALAAA